MEYKIITSDSFIEFEREVNKYLKKGWKAKDNITFDHENLPYQKLIRTRAARYRYKNGLMEE